MIILAKPADVVFIYFTQEQMWNSKISESHVFHKPTEDRINTQWMGPTLVGDEGPGMATWRFMDP